jgi:hypothetical protein
MSPNRQMEAADTPPKWIQISKEDGNHQAEGGRPRRRWESPHTLS